MVNYFELTKTQMGIKVVLNYLKKDGGIVDRKIKTALIETIIEDVENELEDEEIIHLVLQKTVAENINHGKLNNKKKSDNTFGQKAADNLAKFAGSWKFVIGFGTFLICWIIFNIYLGQKSFDPYPFILLNLILSCLAAIQAPLIMMSQNRQEEKDRRRAENDYKVNLKTEIIIQDIHKKLDEIIKNQEITTNETTKINQKDID